MAGSRSRVAGAASSSRSTTWTRFVARLKNVGVRFRNEVMSGPGGKEIILDDPDGNPIELFEARV